MSDLPPIQVRIAGVSFENRDGTPRQPFVKRLKAGDPLVLRREQDNPFDPNAIAIDWLDADGAHQLGYVPRNMAELLAPMADEGAHFTGRVVRRGQAKPAPGRPLLYGARIAIEGDTSALAGAWRSGMEPSVLPEAHTLAPALGGRAS